MLNALIDAVTKKYEGAAGRRSRTGAFVSTTLWLLAMPVRVGAAQLKRVFWIVRYFISVTRLWLESRLQVMWRLAVALPRMLRVFRSTILPDLPHIVTTSRTSDRVTSRVLVLAPVDWSFRIQRPQHLSRALADSGCDVLYINPTIFWAPTTRALTLVSDLQGIRVVTLFHRSGSLRGRYLGITPIMDDASQAIATVLSRFLQQKTNTLQPVIVVQQPGWLPIVERLGNYRIIADWMDLHRGFSNVPTEIVKSEATLWWLPDAVTFTSPAIRSEAKVSGQQETCLIRNGTWSLQRNEAEVSSVTNRDESLRVGYFGAIADWFDATAIKHLHDTLDSIEIDIVGHVTDEAVNEVLKGLVRVRLFGEVPYAELSKIAGSWRAGLIPFKINELTLATNPVKLYEYASLGIPVVSTPLPEVVRAADECAGIFIAETAQEFSDLTRAAIERGPGDASALKAFASRNSWSERGTQMMALFDDHLRVSVIILAFNNSHLTIQCLESLLFECDYTNKQIIVVDNCSQTEEIARVERYLDEFADNRVTLIKNGSNVGYAKGMNAGIRAASGDFVVLLNNDTQVTHGWIRRLLRHMRRNEHIGLLGPMTDNCGNQAKVTIKSGGWRTFAAQSIGLRRPTAELAQSLGFFCVMTTSTTIKDVGLLSEDYGLGFFEDDDYCARVRQSGRICAIAHDVFVHHEMHATFKLLGDDVVEALMEENKKLFESKWGPWIPHSHVERGEPV